LTLLPSLAKVELRLEIFLMRSFLKLRNECGQTLIEVVVALAVTIIAVTALTLIAVNSVRNSQFAQNEAQAKALMEKTLEQVRLVRDSQGWGDGVNTGFSRYTANNTTCYKPQQNGTTWELQSVSCPEGLADADGFYRTLTLCDGQFGHCPPCPSGYGLECIPELDANSRMVSVVIGWFDLTGYHSVKSDTVLSKWQ